MGHKKTRPQATILNEAKMESIMKKTLMERNKVFNMYKDFMRDCPDGLLTLNILELAHKQFSSSGDATGISKVIMNAFDINQDGAINFEEYADAMSLVNSDNLKSRITLAFRMFDDNHNGYLEKKEIYNTLRAIVSLNGDPASPKEVRKQCDLIMNRFDFSKDGRIKEDQFVQTCLEDTQLAGVMFKVASL